MCQTVVIYLLLLLLLELGRSRLAHLGFAAALIGLGILLRHCG